MDITLEEFEIFAIARLKVLTNIYSLFERSLPPSQLAPLLALQAKSHIPLSSNTARNMPLDEERRADELGHWILRLAFCRSPDLREKFVRCETELFKWRFESDDRFERSSFLKSLDLDWESVDGAEQQVYAAQLRACMPWGTKDEQFRSESWFKVPWYTVPDLVATRRVFVKGGNAYVPQSLQISLVLQAFRSKLERALELTAKSLPRMDEDDRLLPILSHLASSFLSNLQSDNTFFGVTDGSSTSIVTADMIDGFAKKHFPACQYNLWQRLKKDRHLKHFGRLQFGLFLKALGLPLEESLVYWRRAFGATMTDDKFNKEYKYNIRHGYGQEGKRANYPAKSCQQILTQNQPGAQDSHGCPYRHFSPEVLSTFLTSAYPVISMGSPELKEVLDSVKKSHYHIACTRVFELTHSANVKKGEGLGNGNSVNHPNEYFNASLAFETAASGDVKPKIEAKVQVEDAMQVD